jgi:phytanoyl-CoA hydroxylase
MQLSIDQIIEYQTRGYIVAEDVLTDADLQPVIDELKMIIDERANALYAEGKITELHEDAPFERRFLLLHAQCAEIGRSFDIMYQRGEAMFRFLKNDNLLNIVECLLGSELSCNPIQHIRAKLPARLVNGELSTFENVPWHQDAGVTLEEADPSEIITFWLPLVDATAETGCMELIPDVFKRGILVHQAAGGTSIVPEEMPLTPPETGECRKGGIVIMNKYTPHRGTTNSSNIVRWSLDLRYHKTGAASGRPTHPSFVARSKADPAGVLESHAEWSRLWEAALAPKAVADKFHRV